ncbi:MAG: hypothetical protein H0X24_01905 [Ktedonobacterales bacterium]|nr:hypothetical protein [Ktedonobacterales bacterium]
MELGNQDLTVALFEQFPIRRTWQDGEWWYSVVDMMGALTASPNARRYWSNLKRDMRDEEKIDVYSLGVRILKMPDSIGRMQKTDCANTQMLLRLIQSVKSPNAEPFKQWLADVGAQVIEDAEEHQLRADYRLKLHRFDGELHELVSYRGIVTPEQHQALTDANYAGLYGVASEQALIQQRHLPFTGKPPEFMGSEEMGINIFQRTQAAARIKERDLHGSPDINAAAEDVGVEIRLTLERLGRPMPEDLPQHKLLSRGDWVPEEELALSDWDNSDEGNEDNGESPPPIVRTRR